MSKPQQEQARRQGMRLLDEGWTQRRASQAVGVSERTMRQWVSYRRKHGLKALVRDERGRVTGQGRTLSAAQEKGIRRLIRDQTPDKLKLPFALWTRKAVGQLIWRRHGLRLPVRTLGEYLKRWGFTVHHLPSCSPELNPDEWLNRSLKSKLATLPASRTEAQLHRQTIAQLRSCQKQPALIARCFSSCSTAYAA